MRTISLPFRFDGYGAVADTTNLSRIWADRVRGVVAVALGERLMRPNFGCPSPVHLFTSTDGIYTVLDTDLASAFATWLPDLRYTGMTIEEEVQSGTVYVEVRYVIPDRSTSEDSVSIAIEVD